MSKSKILIDRLSKLIEEGLITSKDIGEEIKNSLNYKKESVILIVCFFFICCPIFITSKLGENNSLLFEVFFSPFKRIPCKIILKD